MRLAKFARKWIEGETTLWQKDILGQLISELEHSPGRKGRAVRGHKNSRVISKGGFRAAYKFDTAKRTVDVEAVTAPLASIAGERYSVFELPRFKAMLEEPPGTPLVLSREEAIAIVREGFGSRPDLPSGEEYVRRVRSMWGGVIRAR